MQVLFVFFISWFTLNPPLFAFQNNNNVLSSAGDDISTWRDLNTARCCMAILAWIVLSITASTDRLTDNLRAGDDEFLEDVGTQQKVWTLNSAYICIYYALLWGGSVVLICSIEIRLYPRSLEYLMNISYMYKLYLFMKWNSVIKGIFQTYTCLL